MNERNCDNCIYATRSGGCVAWSCEPIPIREAEKAWKKENEPVLLTIEERANRELERMMKTVKEPKAEPGLIAEWECLGHRMGFLKHPMSVDYRCTNCGYESYWSTPTVCPNCHAKMERSEEDGTDRP